MTKLSFAIPSKGRLKENAEAWLSSCGFKLRQVGGGRGYSAELRGMPDVDVMLLSAREISEGLISGGLHLGVTGEDLLHDLSRDVPDDVHVLHRLGFGNADVVVAVPAAWIDVDTMSDLEAAGAQFRQKHGRRMRVATKYLRLTRRFFAARSVGEYRIVESAGATEAAPAAGSAELIVDITTTGATLRANDLKILSDGLILKSEAALTGSKGAAWSADSLTTLRVLLDRFDARESALLQKKIETGADVSEETAMQLEVMWLDSRTLICPENKVPDVARALAEIGCEPVVVTAVQQIFRSENPVYQDFVSQMS
ncbi:MAG: ATP phosphoribosyltransferase [Pseudomonadota bacterium]